MSLVHQLDELPAALDEAFNYDSKVIVEAYVEGAASSSAGSATTTRSSSSPASPSSP